MIMKELFIQVQRIIFIEDVFNRDKQLNQNGLVSNSPISNVAWQMRYYLQRKISDKLTIMKYIL